MRGAKGMHSVEAAVQQQHGGEGREGGEGGEEGPSVGGGDARGAAARGGRRKERVIKIKH